MSEGCSPWQMGLLDKGNRVGASPAPQPFHLKDLRVQQVSAGKQQVMCLLDIPTAVRPLGVFAHYSLSPEKSPWPL